MKDSLKRLAETTTRMHREGGWVQGRNHFVTNYRSQNMNDFFLELCLILLLFLLLKNAPKKTLSEQMCPKAPQWPPRFLSKVGHVCEQVQKNMKDSLKSLAETTTRMHREGGWVQGRNHFVTKYRSQNMHDFCTSNSTWSRLCFYFSRTLPRRHWAPECAPRLPNDFQNESQIEKKLDFFAKWVMCVNKVQKNMKP